MWSTAFAVECRRIAASILSIEGSDEKEKDVCSLVDLSDTFAFFRWDVVEQRLSPPCYADF